jgi:hypothetical protein
MISNTYITFSRVFLSPIKPTLKDFFYLPIRVAKLLYAFALNLFVHVRIDLNKLSL